MANDVQCPWWSLSREKADNQSWKITKFETSNYIQISCISVEDKWLIKLGKYIYIYLCTHQTKYDAASSWSNNLQPIIGYKEGQTEKQLNRMENITMVQTFRQPWLYDGSCSNKWFMLLSFDERVNTVWKRKKPHFMSRRLHILHQSEETLQK